MDVNPSPEEEESRPHQAQQSEPVAWPVPLARITTCGGLKLEVLQHARQGESDPRDPVYGPTDASLLAKKGASTALLLLALLASQPAGFATKDLLSEHLRHVPKDRNEEEERDGLKRVDNVVCDLRHLLFPPLPNESAQDRLLRRRLIAYQRASQQSGPGYQLAGLPLVWLDVEAIGEHIKRAKALEQFGEDGLAEWRAAYELASQGPFLPGEIYSDWASARREAIEAHLWDCVQILWRRVVEQGEAGQIEAIGLLRRYWQGHKTCEDALRPLLELLGKRECFGEAETYYQQFCQEMEEEGRQPDRRTREVMEFLRALQIQRKPTIRAGVKESIILLANQQHDSPADFSPILPQGFSHLPSFFTQLTPPDQEMLRAYQSLLPFFWEAHYTSHRPITLQEIEVIVQDLCRIAIYGNEPQQGQLLALLCQYHQFALNLARDQGHFEPALHHARWAFLLATKTGDNELIAASLYWRGLAYFDMGQISLAANDLCDALSFARRARSQLQGMVHLEAARFLAYLESSKKEQSQIYQLLDHTQQLVESGPLEDDAGHVKLDQGRYAIGRAATLLALKRSTEARKELEVAAQLTPQEQKRRHAYITLLRARTYFVEGNFDYATSVALDAATTCLAIQSKSNLADLARLYVSLTQTSYHPTPALVQLGVMVRANHTGAHV